jgi:predicted CopG family antitoxin
MARKTVSITPPIYNKLKKMGFAGQSLGDLIDDLCDFAKDKIEDFYEFLAERYPDDDDEEEEDKDEEEE